jgi:hypothetical protein
MEEETWPQESYTWNRINEAFIRKNKVLSVEPSDIFLPHSTVVLYNIVDPDVSWNFAV